jgi:hypothetical protein
LFRIQDQRKRTIVGINHQIPGVGMKVSVIRMGQKILLAARKRDLQGEIHRAA